MIETSQAYEEAVKASQIHSYENERVEKTVNKPLFSLLTLVILGYSAYYYQTSKAEETSSSLLANTDVLGVTHSVKKDFEVTAPIEKVSVEKIAEVKPEVIALPQSIQLKEQSIEKVNEPQTDEYLLALKSMEVDLLSTKESQKEIQNKPAIELKDLSKEMQQIVEEANLDDSEYEQHLEDEIKSDTDTKNRVVVVQKGDTLVSIAERYYGDKSYYTKIIASNSQMFDNADLIYVGQKIRLP